LVEVQNFRKINDHCRGIYRIYPNSTKTTWKLSTCNCIMLFKFITMFCRTDNIPQNIPLHSYWIWRIFHRILSSPHKTVMDLNNVMWLDFGSTRYQLIIPKISPFTGHESWMFVLEYDNLLKCSHLLLGIFPLDVCLCPVNAIFRSFALTS
jgi:hypothetical protein